MISKTNLPIVVGLLLISSAIARAQTFSNGEESDQMRQWLSWRNDDRS